jgi:dihydrolipoamide dehydrogenase
MNIAARVWMEFINRRYRWRALVGAQSSHEGTMVKRSDPQPHIPQTFIAGCTYCHLQVASVGYTGYAKELDMRSPLVTLLIGNGKAIALGEAEGMIMIFDAKTGELF